MPIFYDAEKGLSNLDRSYFPPAARAPGGIGGGISFLNPNVALQAALTGGAVGVAGFTRGGQPFALNYAPAPNAEMLLRGAPLLTYDWGRQ